MVKTTVQRPDKAVESAADADEVADAIVTEAMQASSLVTQVHRPSRIPVQEATRMRLTHLKQPRLPPSKATLQAAVRGNDEGVEVVVADPPRAVRAMPLKQQLLHRHSPTHIMRETQPTPHATRTNALNLAKVHDGAVADAAADAETAVRAKIAVARERKLPRAPHAPRHLHLHLPPPLLQVLQHQ